MKPYFECPMCGHIDKDHKEYFNDPCEYYDCWKNTIGRIEARNKLATWFAANPPKTFEDTIFKAMPGVIEATTDL